MIRYGVKTNHLLVVVAAVANVLDIIILGTAWYFTQQTLALCTNKTTKSNYMKY